ncbi:hypothetical protein BJX76DRAFT_353693 [Aspergillus varians]
MDSNFLFVDFAGTQSQQLAVSKKKHAFLQKKHHQRRRHESLQRLKTSIRPFPSESSAGPLVQKDDCEVPACLEAWSLQRTVSPGVLDPFSSLGLSMPAEMDTYFYHFRDYLTPAIYPFVPDKMNIWWWQKSADQPALLQALLATSALHKSYLGREAGVSSRTISKSAMDSLQLRTKAIKGLQRVLENLGDDFIESIILAVANLVCAEAAGANKEAAGAHMSGLRKLVYLRGGLDNLEDLTISTIYCGDFMRGLLTRCPPAFPMSDAWKSKVLQQSRAAQSIHENTALYPPGIRFFTSPWSRDLHSGMRSSLRLFQRLASYYESTEREPSMRAPIDNSLMIIGGHRLLSLSFSGTSASFQESLRLAMLVYCATRILDLQWINCVPFAVEDLRQSLHSSLSILQDTACDLLFWILFVGGMASQGLECHRWFVIRLGEAAERLAVTDWNTALSLLRQFFFVIRPAEKQPERLWNSTVEKLRINQSQCPVSIHELSPHLLNLKITLTGHEDELQASHSNC